MDMDVGDGLACRGAVLASALRQWREIKGGRQRRTHLDSNVERLRLVGHLHDAANALDALEEVGDF